MGKGINEQIVKFNEALQNLLMKMQEVDNSCMQITPEISKREFSLVAYLGSYGDSIMTEVADYLKIPMSTATGVVDKLVEKEFLIRYDSPEDRRIVKVGLSALGKETYQTLEKSLHTFGATILENFNSEEQDQFIYYLEAATQRMQKVVT